MTTAPPPRRAPALAALLLALLPGASCAPPPETTPEPAASRYSVEDLMSNVDYRIASFSPTGNRLLVSSDASGIYNAYALPVDGGEAEPLTRSTGEAIFALSYFPGDERFLYRRDQGGDELDHIYTREPDGSTRDLTPGEGLRARFLGWAGDDASFFLATNERDARYFDLYEYDATTYERALAYQGDARRVALVAPGGRYLALGELHTRADSDIHLHDRRTGATRLLTPHEGDVLHTPVAFAPDDSALLLLSDEGSEFSYLERLDLATGERRTLFQPAWGVRAARYSEGGRYLLVEVDRDARSELHLFAADTMEPVALPELPAGEIDGAIFSPDESRLAFRVSSGRRPADIFVLDLAGEENAAGEPRRLARSLNPAIDPEHLVEGEVARFASYDGLEIPGILYLPHGASAAAPVPALVRVHGGPGGQSRLEYDPLTQYLVHRGYAVYAINNRGSSGYGKTFFQLDDRRHGDADLGDCVAAKGMLAATGVVDAERIGILGGSYGGYMVLAALTFRPGEFAAGVDLFGISNWPRTMAGIPPWWESMRQALYREMGHPEDDAERLRAISPLFHAQRIDRPLMVLQGANDPRVLKVESDEIVAAVRANGVPVEYLVFDDEGHGFIKRENKIRAYGAIGEFLDRYLKTPGE